MGRGRGRGRKIVTNNGRSHEEKQGSSGEEVVPARKRRGRPLKQRVAADKPQLADAKILAEGVFDGNADYQHHHQQGEGNDAEHEEKNKRNRLPKDEEMSSDNHHDMEESNSSSTRSSNDESTATRSSGGFRLNGSRRKSTPRRAAEVGL